MTSAALQVGLPSFTSAVSLAPVVLTQYAVWLVAFVAFGYFCPARTAFAAPLAGCVGLLLASSFDARVIRVLTFAILLAGGGAATELGIALRRHHNRRKPATP